MFRNKFRFMEFDDGSPLPTADYFLYTKDRLENCCFEIEHKSGSDNTVHGKTFVKCELYSPLIRFENCVFIECKYIEVATMRNCTLVGCVDVKICGDDEGKYSENCSFENVKSTTLHGNIRDCTFKNIGAI